MNLFDGRITEDADDHVIVSSPDIASDIRISHGVNGVEGQKVAVALRPEKIAISRDALDLPNVVTGTVDEVAYMGNLSVYYVKLDTGKRVRVTQSNLTRSDDGAITWDERVNLGWDGAAGVVVTA